MIQTSLYKKFSIGVSFGQITDMEFISLMKEFKDFIHDIYFSPVEDILYQSRYGIYNFDNTTAHQRLKFLYNVINVAKCYEIQTTLTLNTRRDVNESFDIYKNYKNIFNMNQVTTTSDLAIIINRYNKNEKIICSYNEGIYSNKKLKDLIDLNCFSAIVLGNHFLRDFKTFDFLYKKKIETVLLVNNGCLSDCQNFCKQHKICEEKFNESLTSFSVEELYAKESLFPEELHKFYLNDGLIKVIKLSTRPIKYTEFRDLLNSYISGDSEQYINKTKYNYHLYGRLAYFKKFYNDFNYHNIISQKKKIWSSYVKDSVK